MGKFKVFIHTLLIATSPALLIYPQTPDVQQLAPETLDYGFSYDDVLHLLNDLENGALEKRCDEQELDRINQFIAHLAHEGRLPTDSAEELENDIAQLLHISNSPYEYALSIGPDGELHAYFTPSGEVVLCGGWVSKKWKQTKEFCKKHKKTILIGTAIVVGAATVIVTVGAATGTAVAAVGAAAASANDHHHAPKYTIATPELKNAIETQITTFKETLIAEDYLNTELPIEENMRTLGSLFAHQSAQDLASSPQLSHEFETMCWYNNGLGHTGIDQKFSTDYAPLYATPQADFNTLAYQTRGEQALTCGYYNQAIHDFGKAIDLNPTNPLTYLERGIARFSLGEYDRSLEDYHQFISKQEQKTYPLSVPEFSRGFAKGLPKGVYESGEGLVRFVSDVVVHPIRTGEQIWEALTLLTNLVQSEEWQELSQAIAPEIHKLVKEWDALPSDQRGELAGYAFGKYGADIVIPGALAKAVSKGLKGAQKLNAVCNGLKNAEKTLILESVSHLESGQKIAAVIQGKTATIAEKLGFNAREISQLENVGKIERDIGNVIKNASNASHDVTFTNHALQRAVERGVSRESILEALESPLKIEEIKIDTLGRPSQRIVGRKAEVVLNPDTKQIVSVNPTSTRKSEKLNNELSNVKDSIE